MSNYAFLPQELKNIILEFDGQIKYRRGKYMNQLNLKDPKWDCLKSIPQKKFSDSLTESMVSLRITRFKSFSLSVNIDEKITYNLLTLFYMSNLTGVSFLNDITTEIC
jgi:hypothetical protein